MKIEVIYIDPPSGWMYGFPRRVDEKPEDMTFPEWFVSLGYPEDSAVWASENCGMITRTIEEEEGHKPTKENPK